MIVALNRVRESPDAFFLGSWVESASCLRVARSCSSRTTGPENRQTRRMEHANRSDNWVLWDVMGQIVSNGSKLEFINDGEVQKS